MPLRDSEIERLCRGIQDAAHTMDSVNARIVRFEKQIARVATSVRQSVDELKEAWKLLVAELKRLADNIERG